MNNIDKGRTFLKADEWKEWSGGKQASDEGKGVAMPLPEKPFPSDAVLIDLVAPEDISVGNASLREVIGIRRSRRQYKQEALTLEELSFLLWATQGVKTKHEVSNGVLTFRTVPSGGSRHSFETYLLINNVNDITPGLYRYLPMEHKLLFIRNSEDDLAAQIGDACLGQSFVGKSAVTFIWTSIPYRMEWRYQSLAHKVIAIDAGHLCQNLYLASESIGAGTCGIGAYCQEEMDAIVGVDGEDEFVVYIAPVGRV